jgi:hypothetical protein
VMELVEASTLSFHIVLTFPVQTILLRYHPSHIGQGVMTSWVHHPNAIKWCWWWNW